MQQFDGITIHISSGFWTWLVVFTASIWVSDTCLKFVRWILQWKAESLIVENTQLLQEVLRQVRERQEERDAQ